MTGNWTEGWDGYATCRRRVMAAIAETGLANPVFIGGDNHSFWVTDLKAEFGNPSARRGRQIAPLELAVDVRGCFCSRMDPQLNRQAG